MKTINGKRYYSVNDVAQIIGKTPQTIRGWDYYSATLESQGKDRLIPSAEVRMKHGAYYTAAEAQALDIDGKRFYSEAQVEQIVAFSQSIKRGTLAGYSRTRCGEKGKRIQERFDKIADMRRKTYESVNYGKLPYSDFTLRYVLKQQDT